MPAILIEVVKRTVKYPYKLPEELANIAGEFPLNPIDTTKVLADLGLYQEPDRKSFLYQRWNCEAVIITWIAHLGRESIGTWFDGLTPQLEQKGLSREGARVFALEFLKQMNVKTDWRYSSDFRLDIRTLQSLAVSEDFPVHQHRETIERAARFAVWAATRFLVALNPELVQEWVLESTQIATEADSGQILSAWSIFALSRSFRDLNNDESVLFRLRKNAPLVAVTNGFVRKDICELYKNWWNEGHGLPYAAGWQQLRRIVPNVKTLAHEMIEQSKNRWREAWCVSAIQNISESVTKTTSFHESICDVPLLEVHTGIKDTVAARRLFAWQILAVSEEALYSMGKTFTVNDVTMAIINAWKEQLPLTNKAVMELLRRHGYDDIHHLDLLAKLLKRENFSVGNISYENQVWLLGRALLLYLREARALGIGHNATFYDTLHSNFLSKMPDLANLFADLGDYDISGQVENALLLLGLDRNTKAPDGVVEWRRWMESRPQSLPLRVAILDLLKVAAADEESSVNAALLTNEVRDSPLGLLTKLQEMIKNLSDQAAAGTLLQNQLQLWVQETEQKASETFKELNEQHQRIEKLTESLHLRESDLQQVQNRLANAGDEAVARFLKTWNQGEGVNSSLNWLYAWGNNNESSELVAQAKELLRRLARAGVKPSQVESVGKVILLDGSNPIEWDLAPGTRLSDYDGKAYVVTPEWRFGDLVLQKACVVLAPKNQAEAGHDSRKGV